VKEEEGLGMEAHAEHYERLLGLDGDWQVLDVELVLEEQRVAIRLESVAGAEFCCPECGEKRSLKDHAKQREWRHMDTMQFETLIRARVPRTDCPECEVKTCAVPWADLHERFTLMFEACAVRVLQAASSVEQASKLLGLNWKVLHRIMECAVERGLAKRELDEVEHVGMDEKSFGRGHDYVSVLTDIDGARVLEVSRGRDEAATNLLWSALSGEQKSNVKAVAMEMWPAFANSAGRHVPEAEIVHDRFHIFKHLNEAVDKVRRQEHRALRACLKKRKHTVFKPICASEAILS
jgi:transposase